MAKRKTKADQPEVAPEKILAFKGFDKDLKCRGFQYTVGQTYTTDKKPVRCTEHGFHACENPFDVWKYYGPAEGNRFGAVDLSGEISREDGGDTKVAAATITVTAELTLPAFIGRAIDWIIDLTKGKGDDPSGNGARIGSSGNGAQIGSSGNDARIGSSGYGAQIGSSGNDARIGSSGNDAQIGSSGNDARIGSSGNGAQIDTSGERAVIASAGYGARVKGAVGAWISLAEYDITNNCCGFATGCIGKDGLKPDVWYQAQGGKLVEVE